VESLSKQCCQNLADMWAALPNCCSVCPVSRGQRGNRQRSKTAPQSSGLPSLVPTAAEAEGESGSGGKRLRSQLWGQQLNLALVTAQRLLDQMLNYAGFEHLTDVAGTPSFSERGSTVDSNAARTLFAVDPIRSAAELTRATKQFALVDRLLCTLLGTRTQYAVELPLSRLLALCARVLALPFAPVSSAAPAAVDKHKDDASAANVSSVCNH
jgi:hypothetical protein